MSKFKVGDKVILKRKTPKYLYSVEIGTQLEISGFTVPNGYPICKGGEWFFEENLDFMSTNKTINNMSLIERAKLAFKKEPERSFIKAGVLDSNENLTNDGKELLLNYLLEKNKDDFKTTIIDPIIAEDEKNK